MTERRRRKVWVHHVGASASRCCETRLDVAVRAGLGPDQRAAAHGVRRLLRQGRGRRLRHRPEARTGVATGGAAPWSRPRTRTCTRAGPRWSTSTTTADRRRDPRGAARGPTRPCTATTRAGAASRRCRGARWPCSAPSCGAPSQDCYDAMDRQHERLRSFRNIVLVLALCIAVLVGITILAVWAQPVDPCRCASPPTAADPKAVLLNCPTGTDVPRPATAATSSWWRCSGCSAARWPRRCRIRNLRGTSTPYDVPVALALLKVPLGAFTAILGLVAIQGELRPGPVGAGLAAADPGVRAGARLRPAGVHLLAGPPGAVAARRRCPRKDAPRSDGDGDRRRRVDADQPGRADPGRRRRSAPADGSAPCDAASGRRR